MNHRQDSARDELRARFTKWLDTLVYRAKLNYIYKDRKKVETVPIEEVEEECLSCPGFEDECIRGLSGTDGIWFEEEELEKAFKVLSPARQQILLMLFVEDKKPCEIARELNCSVQHVYNQRSLALKKLRQALGKGGESLG